MGFRSFSLRGLEKAQGEWDLVCLSLNVIREPGRAGTSGRPVLQLRRDPAKHHTTPTTSHRPSAPRASLPSFPAISEISPVFRLTSTTMLSRLGVEAMAQASQRLPLVSTA